MHGGNQYFSATFSPSSQYYLLANLGNGTSTEVPIYTLFSLNSTAEALIERPAGVEVEVLQNNEVLEGQLEGLDMPERVYLDVPSANETGICCWESVNSGGRDRVGKRGREREYWDIFLRRIPKEVQNNTPY